METAQQKNIEIKLVITPQVYEDLKEAIETKTLLGSAYGICDGFLLKLVNKIEAEEKIITFRYKQESL